MSQRNVVLAVATLLTVMAVSDSGTFAMFYDTESSMGNRFTAWSFHGWVQSTGDDFTLGTTGSNVDTTTSPGDVSLSRGDAAQCLFAFGGGGSAGFYRYDVQSNAWATMASAPAGVTDGAALAYDQDRYIYAIRGGGHSDLWRYDVQSNSWESLASAPGPVGSGGDLVYDDGVLYVLQGGGNTGLWTYDIAAESWTTLSSTPSGVSSNGALASYQGTLYVMRGSGTLTIWTFHDGTWSSLNFPEQWLTTGMDMFLRADGKLVILWLNGNQGCGYIYDIQSKTWTRESSLDLGTNIQDGIDLAFDGSYIYALQSLDAGGYWGPFWRYVPNSGWWSWGDLAKKLPGAVGSGACLVSATAGGDHATPGVLISSVFDAGSTFVKYTALSWSAILPSGTEIRFEVRAADTESELENAAWILVNGSSSPISDLFGRYAQWKATLTTADPTRTPVLQEVILYYMQSPRSWVQTTYADFSSGSWSNIDITTSPGSAMLTAGTAGQYIFAFQGGGSAAFHRYNVASDTWTAMTAAPGAVTDGAALAYDHGRYIYALQGGSSALWRYDMVQNSWAVLGNAPGIVGSGGDLVYDDGVLYVLQGGGGTGLWTYDIADGEWSTAINTPAGVGAGGAMVSYQGTLYVMRGGGTLGIWAYHGGTWSSLNFQEQWLVSGSDMVLGPNGKLYTFWLNGNQGCCYIYDPQLKTWNRESTLDWGTNIQDGIDLAFDGSYIYALQSTETPGSWWGPFWKCDLGSGWWAWGGIAKKLPGTVGPGASLVSVTSGGQYHTPGVLTSSTFDTGTDGAGYGTLSWTATLPPGTAVRFEIRASNTLVSGQPDAEWTPVSDPSSSLSSISGRYVQWRAILTTDEINQTPILHEVKLQYVGWDRGNGT